MGSSSVVFTIVAILVPLRCREPELPPPLERVREKEMGARGIARCCERRKP
jgi:hypothetical protein